MKKTVHFLVFFVWLICHTSALDIEDLQNAIVGEYSPSAFVQRVPLWSAQRSEYIQQPTSNHLVISWRRNIQVFELEIGGSVFTGTLDYSSTAKYQGFTKIRAVFSNNTVADFEVFAKDFDSVKFLDDGTRISSVDNYLKLLQVSGAKNYGEKTFALALEANGNWFFVKKSKG